MKWTISCVITLLSIVYKPVWCNCIVNCFQSIEGSDEDGLSRSNRTVLSIPELTTHQTAKLVAASSAAENLTQFCSSVYSPAERCLNKCPDGDPLKALTLKTLSVTDFVCNKKIKELSPLWPCIKRVTDSMANLCRSRCRRWEADMTDILSQVKLLSADMDDQSKTRILAVACTYVQCKNDCESETLETRCGSTARRIVQEMLLVSVLNVEEMLESAEVDSFGAVWPKHCEQLKKALSSSAVVNYGTFGLVTILFGLLVASSLVKAW